MNTPEVPKKDNGLITATMTIPAGELKVSRIDMDDTKGFCISMIPAGADEEIDVAWIGTPIIPDEPEENVNILVYTDPADEEYTHNLDILRSDIVEAMIAPE